MRECPDCRRALDDAVRDCPHCGSAIPGPLAAARGAARAPRSRRLFWAFAAAMAVAVLGGGAIVILARRSIAERRDRPDAIAPGASRGPPAPPSPGAPR